MHPTKTIFVSMSVLAIFSGSMVLILWLIGVYARQTDLIGINQKQLDWVIRPRRRFATYPRTSSVQVD